MDVTCTEVESLLIAEHWLPDRLGTRPPPARGGDLIEWLEGEWESASRQGDGGSMLRTLRRWRHRRSRLMIASCRVEDWLGLRLVWWPRGVPSPRLASVLSSRLGRRWYDCPGWFAALRYACGQAKAANGMLISARGASASQFVERSASLFGLGLLRVITPTERDTPDRWLRRVRRDRTPDSRGFEAWISPRLSAEPARFDDLPVADRALLAMSDDVFMLSARDGGNVQRLVRECLALPPDRRPSVRVSADATAVPDSFRRECLRLGAEAFAGDRPSESPVGERMLVKRETSATILESPPRGEPYLNHWTREANRGWADESPSQYLDQLIRGDPTVDRSALATLCHIVRGRRLIGGDRTVRGDVPVVCFTEVELGKLAGRRVYRPHRGTWDYERYGISIRRGSLERLGARPVYYGGERDWQSLPAELRPFFQLSGTRSSSKSRIDWTAEREWRLVGELNLDCLAPDDAILFVPTREEALILAEISPWPIVVIGR